ncbi:MAG TPA: DUF350 domain-containing protein [Candidatus Saccharimonadales bacterium]|nr:DUF350 domain-containing protein [Candidatus Saccharimonadales bacterium]
MNQSVLKTWLLGMGMVALPLATRAESTGANWHAQSLGQAVLQTAIFAGVGIALAIIGYKLFDLFTPGQLHKEILENKNMAAGMIGAAVILGVCILVVAAMLA